VTPAEKSCAQVPKRAPAVFQDAPDGFRHLFGPPTGTQRFRVRGRDPLVSMGNQAAARTLMRKLSLRMEADIQWPESLVEAVKPWENPETPAGYTYLFQFVGHDLVHSTVPFSTFSTRPRAAVANARRSGLALETIYGQGPIACPQAYAPAGPRNETRVKLRLGRIQRDDRTSDASCPYRDIARASSDAAMPALNRDGRPSLTDPMLFDPRNDDHAILSQLTTLFVFLHNGLVDLLGRAAWRDAGSPASAAQGRFLAARAIATGIYRRIVRDDLLRRFLDPEVYEVYAQGFFLEPQAWRAGEAAWTVPLEFTHGAIRFGHALVRDEYRINDGAIFDLVENLTKTSLADPANMPLNESWVVQWSHFFSITDVKPNLAKRIGPHFSSGLGSARIFPAIDEGSRVGLAYRDLVSACLAGLWSLCPLIEEIRRRRPSFVNCSALLDDRIGRAASLAEWLSSRRAFGGLDDEDITTIANDPPLPFFILWEAFAEPGVRGGRLGRLGSIIVAEVVFGALARQSEEAAMEGAGAFPRPLFPEAIDEATFDRATGVASMGDLVTFVSELCNLRGASPAFV
jgi:hypothetical protein